MKNKRVFFIAVFALLFVSNAVFAQELYFAQSYTTSGKAINAKHNWLIPATGKSIFILFNADGIKVRDNEVYLYIDKLSGNKYEPYNSFLIKFSEGKNWFVHREKFTEAGKYKVFIVDKDNRELASDYLTIKVKAPKLIDTKKASAPYYKNVRMVFSEWVIGGKPFRELKVKYLSRKPDSVCVYLKHPDSLNTSVIYADFYKQNPLTKNWELFDTKEYAILPMWDYIFFKYFFDKPGIYKVEVYDEKREFIKSAYLKVEE